MPPKTKRTLEIEQDLAGSIAHHRKRMELTYEALAERMKVEGCEIHASGIQKTEKSGRRITVDELVGYSKVFGIPVDALLDIGEQLPTEVVWRDLLAAEGLRNVMETASAEYWRFVEEVKKHAETNPELHRHIQDRYDRWAAKFAPEAKAQAERDGEDISTPDKWREFLYRWDYENPIMKTARDALGGAFRDGE
jgi:transcriptional regulator with XRE-family HTH domain